MSTIISALDLGTDKFVALIGELVDGDLEVVGVGKGSSAGLDKGIVVNPEEVARSAQQALNKAERMAATKVDSVHVGITGAHLEMIEKNATVSISHSDRTIRQEDVLRVLDLAGSVDTKPDRRLIYAHPRQFFVDGQGGISDPIGMKGKRLDVQLQIISASDSSFDNLLRSVRSLGVTVASVVPQPFIYPHALLKEDEMDQGVLVVDFGGGTTEVALFSEGKLEKFRTLPVGGFHLTRDLTVKLNADFEEAERVKKECGLHRSKEGKFMQGEKMLVQLVAGERVQFDKKEITEVLSSRIEEIVEMISGELDGSQLPNADPFPLAGVVLTGGSAQLSGLGSFLKDNYDLTLIEERHPSQVEGLRDIIEDPRYSVALGLLKYGTGKRKGISLLDRDLDAKEKSGKVFQILRKLLGKFRLF